MAVVGSGVLNPGESADYQVALEGGQTYSIYVKVEPDRPEIDFDLFVYDENDNLIIQDVATDSDAFCLITPEQTGTFRLMVRAEKGVGTYQVSVYRESSV